MRHIHETISEDAIFQAALSCGLRQGLLTRQHKKLAARVYCDYARDSCILVDSQGQVIAHLALHLVHRLARKQVASALCWRKVIGTLGAYTNITLALVCVYLFGQIKSAFAWLQFSWLLIGLIFSLTFAMWNSARRFPFHQPAVFFLSLDILVKLFAAYWGLISSLMAWGITFGSPLIILNLSFLLMPIPPIVMLLILVRSGQRSE